MTTNEKICKWLGFIIQERPFGKVWTDSENKAIHPDFLRDRNQQKWIEEKLGELNCRITYTYSPILKTWRIVIEKEKYGYMASSNQSKDLAFIQIVEQIIDKDKNQDRMSRLTNQREGK